MRVNVNIEELAGKLTGEQKIRIIKLFYLIAILLFILGIPVFCYAFFTGSVIMASLSARDFTLADQMLSVMWYLIGAFLVITVGIMLCIRLIYPFYNEKVYHFIKRNTKRMNIKDARMSFALMRKGKRVFRLKLTVKVISAIILVALYCVIFLSSAKLNIMSQNFDEVLRFNAFVTTAFVAVFELFLFFLLYMKLRYPLFFGKYYLCIE